MVNEKRTWICPHDGTYNSGNYCIRCGSPCTAEETAEPVFPTAAEMHSEAAELGDISLLFDAVEPEETLFRKLLRRSEKLLNALKAHKTLVLGCAAGLTAFLLFGFFLAPRLGICVFGHRWQGADCLHPMTCAVCGKESGLPGPHRFAPASCTESAVCTVCGSVSGEALGHDWQDATCTEPKFCSRCGITEGKPNGHTEGRTVILKAPAVLESGEEEVLCRVCGQSMGVRSCELISYVEGESFLFTVRDYMRLLLDGITHLLPEANMIVLTDKDTGEESFNLWMNNGEDRSDGKAAYAVLYDLEARPMAIDEDVQLCPAAVCWHIVDPNDTESIKKLLPLILSTVSPDPIDMEVLLESHSVNTDELYYRYENDGDICRLVITTKALKGKL